MKRWQSLVLILTAAALTAGTAGAKSPIVGKALHVTMENYSLDAGWVLTNKCNTGFGGDALKAVSTGFTPNGQYQTLAFYPPDSRFHGAQYTNLLNHGIGRASAAGTTPNWAWDCLKGPGNNIDPVGTYRLIIVDLATGRLWVGHIVVVDHQ